MEQLIDTSKNGAAAASNQAGDGNTLAYMKLQKLLQAKKSASEDKEPPASD